MTMHLTTLKLTLNCHMHGRYTGIDSFNKCMDREHFLNYPYEIDYVYNSRGFRGPEWPSDVDNICWCIGDSFTSGVGQPYEHTWPYVFSSKSNIPVINVSMDGASNMWMARKIIEILEIQPKYIIIQWSYVHRRERDIDIKIDSKNHINSDEERTIWYSSDTNEEDIQNTIDCINLVEINKKNTTIIHTFVPNNVPEEYNLMLMFKDLIEKMNINVVWFDQLDYARDYFHYDIKTSTDLAEKIIASKYINI